MPPRTNLDNALRDLGDAREDLFRGGFDHAQSGFQRVLALLENEPLASLTASTLPDFDFDTWWAAGQGGSHSMSGAPQLEWPRDLPQRVAAQLAYVRRAAKDRGYIVNYMYRVVGSSGNLDYRLHQVLSRTVDPLIRDIARLSELRQPSPGLAELFRQPIPPTGDARLDELLQEAREKFRDPSPVIRKEALERLWDAWERLKTLVDPANKKTSADALLGAAAKDAAFKALLDQEAKALNDIGNNFQIRHFEQGKAPITESVQVDYLFHRCFALIWLLVGALPQAKSP